MRDIRAEMQTVDNPLQERCSPCLNLIACMNGHTRLEGGVLFLGLGVVVLTARRFGSSN